MSIASFLRIAQRVAEVALSTAILIMLAATNLCIGQSPPRQLTHEVKSTNKRIALVIGNGAYLNASPLANPVNDATDMSATLKALGFDVISGTNANLVEMRRLIRAFGERLEAQKGVGLFYYAGHGIEARGRNFLVPVDADIKREVETEDYAVDLNAVLRQMDGAGNGFNIVILDACRNNPFARGWNRSGDSGGLANVLAPTGTFIAFAAAPGSTAADGTGRNGVFTSALLESLKRPGLKLEDVFKSTREAVMGRTSNQQVPWDSSSVKGDFYFSRGSVADTGQPTKNEIVVAKDVAAVEREAWSYVRESPNAQDLRDFLKEFPNGQNAANAMVKLEQSVWDSVKDTKDKARIQAYLSEFPAGANSPLARIKLKQLETQSTFPAVTTSSSGFKLPTLGQLKRPVEILGPFNGEYGNTSVLVDGEPVKVLSESNEKLIFEGPDTVGPSEIILREGQNEVRGVYRNVRISLSAPKTNLLKGEKTALTVTVDGLQGIQTEVRFKLEISGVASFSEANNGPISIQPHNVDAQGRFELKRTVVGKSAGNWTVTATVLSPAIVEKSSPLQAPAGTNHATFATGTVRKNFIGMELVYIPPGEFMMGSSDADLEKALLVAKIYRPKDAKLEWFEKEQPQRRIKIDSGFWMGKFVVTQSQWQQIMGTTIHQQRDKSRPKSGGALDGEGANYPMYYVNWDEAKEFIRRLNQRNDAFEYSLATEAQWEYAARAGTTTLYYWGDDTANTAICSYANVWDQTAEEKTEVQFRSTDAAPCSDGYLGHAPVGSFIPNKFGLYDMSGNVWQWVEDIDTFAHYANRSQDAMRITRGGGWQSLNGGGSRSAARSSSERSERHYLTGFRVVARLK